MQCHAKGLHCSVYLVEPGERSRQRLIGSHAVLMSPCSLSALPPCSLHAGVSDDPASLRQWMAPPVLPRVHLHPDADRFHRQLRSADRLFGPRCDNALACHQFSPVVRAWFATAPADVPMGTPPPTGSFIGCFLHCDPFWQLVNLDFFEPTVDAVALLRQTRCSCLQFFIDSAHSACQSRHRIFDSG